MQYRPLGRTCVQISALCLGTMNFGRSTLETEAHQILNTALDYGINFLDTAMVRAQIVQNRSAPGLPGAQIRLSRVWQRWLKNAD